MMKYQPVNLNFIPKDEGYNRGITDPLPNEKVEKELEAPTSENIPEVETKKEKEISIPRREVFTLEEKIMLSNQIDHLREQLNHSENQVSTLQLRLQDSNNQVNALKNQLKNYEAYSEDLDQVTTLNTNLSELSKENEDLKQQLKQQKDHVQMLYLILLILAIL